MDEEGFATKPVRGDRALIHRVRQSVRGVQILRTIAKGEKVADLLVEGKWLMLSTWKEHALVTLADGSRVIVQGGRADMDLATLSVKRLIGHTHRRGRGPSIDDLNAIRTLGQRRSYIVTPFDPEPSSFQS
jgi:hypothetical protein